MASDAHHLMDELAEEIKVCTRCELHRSRTNAVPGEGNPETDVMFVGEAPGMNEDRQGRPFVGNAGRFLDEMLESIEWPRESVYITNVVKSRPPGNRDPLPDEIEACSVWINRQIEIIDPLLIVTLGRFSMEQWLKDERISRIHGKPRYVGSRAIVPLYHPAAALHQPSLRQVVEEDFKKLPLILDEVRAKRESGDEPPDEASQLKLF